MGLILSRICSVKNSRPTRLFFSRAEVQERGGPVAEKKVEMKALMLEMVLIDYLDETGAQNMKLDQVSG